MKKKLYHNQIFEFFMNDVMEGRFEKDAIEQLKQGKIQKVK
jgi:hypothetical protein